MIVDLPEKERYTIGEVSKAFGLNASTLRFWQTEFSILNPKKDKYGHRIYMPKDIESLKLIYSLVKEQGFKLDAAKDYLNRNLHKANYKLEIVERLEKIKKELLKMKDTL
ncbi:MAG: MerR family transcriptional regulator [Ichthyobacteriaceae bacterium]|nr:MerR family transcriptional regulator [Ichthyobacteriaceae bacterium]